MPMQVVVEPYNSDWAGMFSTEAQLIADVLGTNFRAAHHIGSTAIPLIVAKPIIDLLIVVADLDAVDRHNSDMAALGYEAMGECGIPLRRFFRKDNARAVRTHHVHVFPVGCNQIERHLAFRDFMNAHPMWAECYSKLKLDLVAMHPDSIEQYMAGKDGFIKRMDQLAAKWRLSEVVAGLRPSHQQQP